MLTLKAKIPKEKHLIVVGGIHSELLLGRRILYSLQEIPFITPLGLGVCRIKLVPRLKCNHGSVT